MSIQPRLYRGMRDILPEEMLAREKMLDSVREIFRTWGFAPLSTPAIEYKKILLGKYGEEAERLFYKIEHKEGLALRYDLTVPLARMVAMSNNLPMPFKRYQIQEVWRAERAQPRRGRFREFLQCDVDIIGTDSLAADAEIIALSVVTLDKLGFSNSITRLNHRLLLRGIMEIAGFSPEREMDVCRIVDKLDKIGEKGVREELLAEDFVEESIEKLFRIILEKGNNAELLSLLEEKFGGNPRIESGISDLRKVIGLACDFGAPRDRLKIDLSLSRGLDYYTGTIFESFLPGQPHIGSLTGGGRYDDLLGLFSKKNVPAVGITIGLDRILAALKDAGATGKIKTPTRVLVTVFDEKTLKSSVELTTKLREAGVPAEVYFRESKLKAQFSYADSLGIPYVAILGEIEIEKGVIALKNMATGEQREMGFSGLVEEVMR